MWHGTIVCFNALCTYIHTDPKSLDCDDVCKAVLFLFTFRFKNRVSVVIFHMF